MKTITYFRPVHSPRAAVGQPGDIRDVPDDVADGLIAEGYVGLATRRPEPIEEPKPLPKSTPKPRQRRRRRVIGDKQP